ncbi:hypothetical protein [Brevibacillus laterosporus]|uniref:Uncharacterized protein n=1 Tax=Brevibacillus laterosporus TaxID=1465 RepID=A0AAP3DJX5_BRELA|nr:hypothetical protein [Brevibacillus laterosporus]MCR8982288.1 hypothetical protein [Brevibacillus laterosporus]MCZ0809443.1 hypothetical protein [Brevibacillus laterosporus]MCZ0827842.1 hypothetical protein [Brevibacillus laterosporus]MCZ0851782.1 hypothetical protein [Brevibacillus laterosporus]PPA87949.1 hypothetical protein C4A76_10770 [Brevibacillus laterosporus]
MTADIVVDLDERQRFVTKDPESLRIVIVDQIVLCPIANQINYCGYAFDVDYEEAELTNKQKVRMIFSTKLELALTGGDAL